MVHYRRNIVPNGTYFFTVTLRDRRSDLLIRQIEALRAAWSAARQRVPHEIIAVAVLPDHLHAVITMRDGRGDYSRMWQDIKKGFTRRIAPVGHGRSAWQSRFWEHTLRDETDLQRHVDYVHINPMKHRHVTRLADWPHSSFHSYVRRGLLPPDWAGEREIPGTFGEPAPP